MASGRVLKSLSESGIDIVCDDSKTAIHPKVAARVLCAFMSLAFELENSIEHCLTIRLPQFFPIMPPQPQSPQALNELQSQFCETRSSSLATHAEKIQTFDQAGCAASTGSADDHSDVLYVPAGQKREDGGTVFAE
ncbi:uncharacterized protein B0H18DRAFT_1122627 [Fomitopsis serialis]|uniref:uncharacterized protein n=1 Tax=Fomitopsis serialis TaxID=139415 RepID=UPI0020078553|nr:uncharacterized protein B0H18DRAFT_1122627 [Neoantrodia serialis]KAH9919265.1 hypothetical protein B0H18DRAFT_1122627 [Neoantrodia serialis]